MKVAVIGAGTMGSGIAQTFAQCDAVETVYLCDIKQEFADGGFAKIKKSLDKSNPDWATLNNDMRDALAHYISSKTKRQPMIIPIIMDC